MNAIAAPPGRNQPCPCGSGEKFKRCCGQSAGAPATGARPLALGEQLQQIARDVQTGRAGAHTERLRQITRAHPRNALAHYLLGHAALATGGPGPAADAMAKAIALGLDDPGAHFHLGRARLALGDLTAAERAFKAALNRRPGLAEARFGLANCAFARGEHAAAFAHYQALHDSGQRLPELPHNLAQAALNSRLWTRPETIDFLAGAAGDSAVAQALLAALLEGEHRLDDAEAAANRALTADTGVVLAQLTLARIAARRKEHARVIEMTARITDGDVGEQVSVLSLRGRALEQLGRHDAALDIFAQARALERKRLAQPFDAAGFRSALARHRTRLADAGELPRASGPAPIFIVGFFRCGSTLLEQMLSMHPALSAYGESPALMDVEARLAEQGAPLTASLGEALRAAYWRSLAGGAGVDPTRSPVDKQLDNQLHLPLIRWLFPEARVLHVVRHPLDSMLSSFAHQFDEPPPWSTALTDMAAYYREAWGHVQACRALLPPERYLQLRYEDLVAAPGTVLRQVTDFLGLAWHPAMLDFHRSSRVVRTSSYAQVTEPLYQASRYKYRAYLPYLEPDFLRSAEPTVHAMGYAI